MSGPGEGGLVGGRRLHGEDVEREAAEISRRERGGEGVVVDEARRARS